jgi:molecular chaperone DnaK (HSP70)
MWALDLGTTNTLLARWDRAANRPQLLQLPALARRSTRTQTRELAGGVPSSVHVLDEPTFWTRLGQSPLLARRFFLGKLARIGQPALDLNYLQPKPNFVPSFKRALSLSPLLTIARAGGRTYTAREVAYAFLRELLAEAQRVSGERPRDLVITAPVEAFETYRAELVQLSQRLGVRRLRFLDEPVAAALGYGLGQTRERRVLVVDFGGGTLHMALVRLSVAQTQEGKAQVLAKAAEDIGGNLVDRWILEEFCRRLSWPLDEDGGEEVQLWHRLMLAEACRVKEAVYFDERAAFEVSLPESRGRFEQRVRGEAPSLELTRAELVKLLTDRGLYRMLERCLDDVLQQSRAAGVPDAEIDDVLMVGGSTLLPNVYPFFQERFGRGRVRAWQPFEAVAYGASVFAGGQAVPADFIVHDYALLTHDLKTGKPEYAVIVPRRTRFPTTTDFWKRQLVPTCGLGEPERVFKLVICEIGSGAGSAGFVWDADGRVHRVAEDAGRNVVVKLNEANPAIGHLEPPHAPSDRAPRLEVSFGINAERWLCSTVYDLRTRRHLMKEEPVVKLL